MKFILIDKIESIETGQKLTASKSVSLAEEYLQDHFPLFPVLPGVLLLEGMVESAAWLVRDKFDFAHSMVLLDEAKNVRYKSFAAPGMKIIYTVEAKSIEQNQSSFKAAGRCQDQTIVEAKLKLRHFNLAQDNPDMHQLDREVINAMRQRYKLLLEK